MSRRHLPAIALLVSATLLSACGTGLHSKTYSETGRRDGALTDVGGKHGIAVRNLHVIAPFSGSFHATGETAFVTGALVNNGTTPDSLVGATSDVAGQVLLITDRAVADQIAIPALGTAPIWAIVLGDLSQTVHAGTYIPVTLEFAHAGRVTLQVPAFAGDNGLSSRPAEQNPYGESEK